MEMSESKVVERYETMKLVGEKDLENENQFLHQIGSKTKKEEMIDWNIWSKIWEDKTDIK